MNELLPLDGYGLLFVAGYLVILLVIGVWSFRARHTNSMRDFYLAGDGIGFVVLLLTLYATQYSGNTLFGFPGKTYRIGFSWLIAVHFMTAIVCAYVFFAPQLHRLSQKYHFVTPTDYLDHRYGYAPLNALATVIMVVAISNFLLAQLMAMGRAMEGLTDIDNDQAYVFGVIVLVMIIVVYETLGGFRAVAWTDVVQGSVLMVGFFVLIWLVLQRYGGLETATQKLVVNAPEKVALPVGDRIREWFSYILLVGLGGALYPQSIQRIYAARSAKSLRRSLMIMAFMPLTTTLIVIAVGIIGAAEIQGLEQEASDRLLTVMCRSIQEESRFGYWLVVVLFAAVLAGVMSTADSVLLSISSMLSKDVYGRFVNKNAADEQLTYVGKRISWTVIVVLASLAILLRETTLVTLLDRKFDLLVQLAPAYILGFYWRTLNGRAVCFGLIAGVITALLTLIFVSSKPWGIHPGVYGLGVNVVVLSVTNTNGLALGDRTLPFADQP